MKKLKAISDYWRTIKTRKLPWADDFCDLVRHKSGLEIGGPTKFFSAALPIYRVAGRVDGVNFAHSTHWEGVIQQADDTYAYYGFKRGRQFIAEATLLHEIQDDKYDFLISSNCLEHLANPLKALCEWRRVIAAEGVAVVVVPSKLATFDHKRPTTEICHLLNDFEKDVDEGDMTHLSEILSLHDRSRDRQAGSFEEFKLRCMENRSNRFMHHHVFDMSLLRDAVTLCGFQVLAEHEAVGNLFVLARKRSEVPLNAAINRGQN